MKQKILLLFCVLLCIAAQAQTLIKKMVVPDAQVNATVQAGDTVYLGGNFSSLFSPTRGVARFSPGTPKADVDFPQLAGSDYVQAAEPDGTGGFYVAGYFDNFNGAALAKTTAILHILANGQLDAAFGNVSDNNGYTIYSLKKKGSRLYVGGNFTKLQNITRNYFAALDANTGALLPWLPDAPNGTVNKIDATDSLVFIYGNFNTVGPNYVSNSFAAIYAGSGKKVRNFPAGDNYIQGFVLDSNKLYLSGYFSKLGVPAAHLVKLTGNGQPDIDFSSCDGDINAILKDGSGGWYVAGSFSNIGGVARANLAHILSNGNVDTAFKPVVNSQVLCLAASADTLYIGGYFTTVGGKTRTYVAGVNRTTGAVAAWNPAPDSYVYTLAVYGSTVYIGGAFGKIRGTTTRPYAAAVNFANTLLSWAPQPNSVVNKILLNSNGGTAYLGGSFSSIKAQTRYYLAKVNTITGDAIATWAPQLNSTANTLALVNNILYVGGSFTTVNNINRQYIAAIDTTAGSLNSFIADAGDVVNTIAADSNKLYIGGNFTTIQGASRKYAARFDISTGAIDNWNAGAGFDYFVYALAPSAANVVAGGNFTYYNAQTRNSLGSIDVTAAPYNISPWNPTPNLGSGGINSLVHYGRELIFGGNFYYTDGAASVSNIISLHDSTGVIARHFTQYPNSIVYALSLYDNKLMVGGSYSAFAKTSDGSSLPNSASLAAYDLSTWQLSKENYSVDGSISKIFTDGTGRLIAAGSFNRSNLVYRNYLAAINVKTGMPTDFDPSLNGQVYSLALKDTVLFAGGGFTSTDAGRTNVARAYAGAFSTKTSKTTTWAPNADSYVLSMAIKDSTVYMGGYFSNVKGVARAYAAAVSTTGTGSLKTWAPNTNSTVWAILPVGSSVFIGGEFTTVKGVTRQYLAKCNSTDGTAASWAPNADNVVYALATDGAKIYAGGNFFNISTGSRNGLAVFDTSSSNKLTSFNANLNTYPAVYSIATWGKNIYLGTSALTTINGTARAFIGGIDTTTKKANAFNPSPDGTVNTNSFSIAKKRLAIGGGWGNLGTNANNPYFALFTLPPASPAVSLVFSNLSPTSVKASVTKGDGDGRAFFVKADTLKPSAPADGTTYTGNTVFTKGDKKADTSYAVYTGILDSVTVTGLRPNKKYTFGIYEYNGSGAGTSYNSALASGTITTPCPAYNLHITANDTLKICAGGTVLLKAPAGFKTYKWNTGDTTNSITKPAGNYSVNYTDTDGCAGTTIIAVVADPKPNLGKDSAVKVCPGFAINITNIYNTAQYPTVIWNVARPDSVGVGKDTLIVANATGCRDTAVVTVTLATKPALGADKSLKICSGTTTNITTQYTTTGYTNVVWSTATPTAVGKGNYTLTVTNSFGCMDTAVVKVDTVSKPKTPLVTLAGPANICSGDSTLISASNYTDTTLKISWLRNDTAIANATKKDYYAKTSGAFKLKYTNSTGCSANSAAVTVNVGSRPPVPVITKTGSTNFCQGDSLVLTANASIGLQWYRNNSAIKLATSSRYVVRAGGSYKLVVSGGAGCNATSDSVIAMVTSVAKPTITLVNDTLVSSSATGNQWFENGVAIPGATGQKYSPNDIDWYTVRVTSGACVSPMSDQYLYTANTLLGKKAGSSGVLVYPNPASDAANLQLTGFRGAVMVTITDVTGKLVYSQQKLTNSTYKLPLGNLAAGIYIVRVSDGRRITSVKLVKGKQQTATY